MLGEGKPSAILPWTGAGISLTTVVTAKLGAQQALRNLYILEMDVFSDAQEQVQVPCELLPKF